MEEFYREAWTPADPNPNKVAVLNIVEVLPVPRKKGISHQGNAFFFFLGLRFQLDQQKRAEVGKFYP